jgi:FkbM family methyltransferase
MSHGGRATYVGKNRILTKCVIADAIIGFLVEADDRLLTPWLTLSGEYELDLTNFFLKNLKRNSKCLDVGANFGFFTCLMARFCHQGKVIGIEPNRHVYELLRDNIYINGFQGHAIPKHAAISDLVGTLTLHRRITRSGNTSIQKPDQAFLDVIGEQTSESFQIVCLRVDDLLPEFDNQIDFIKIDVEGAEPLVMRGAKQTISANPQLNIVMEWSPGQIKGAGFNVDDFVNELCTMGLRSSLIESGRLEEIPLEGLLNLEYKAGILLKSSR